MRFFATVDALQSLESMKFPVFSLLAGNFGLFRDEFAADSSLLRGVCEPSVPKLRSPVYRLCAEAAALLSRLHDTRPLSNLATHRKRADAVGGAAGDRLDRQRWVYAVVAPDAVFDNGREH